jgi:Gram-negative bacterial TonB protein C-terminal
VDAVPEYPTLALDANIQARVVIDAVIAANGTLRNVRLVTPPLTLDAPFWKPSKNGAIDHTTKTANPWKPNLKS